MLGKLLQPEVQSLIAARDFTQLRESFAEWMPADLADVVADLPEDDKVVVFRVMPQEQAAAVFEYLDSDEQEELLRSMGREQAVRILNEMSPDDRTALLEELPPRPSRAWSPRSRRPSAPSRKASWVIPNAASAG